MEFCIAAESSQHINLANTFLYVRASVTQANDATLEENSKIAPKCNFLHTLWSQCYLYLNDVLVTQSGKNYPYRSYLETLLSFGKDAKCSQLSSVLWYQNTAGVFNTHGTNKANYTAQKAFAAQSHEIDMLGSLHLDITFHSRYLPNGIKIKYRLIRSKDSFCLHGTPTKSKTRSC